MRTRQRQELYAWLSGVGLKYKQPQGRGPFWLSNSSNTGKPSSGYPFPLNPQFRPERPLTGATRREIVEYASEHGDRAASSAYGVSMQRISAFRKFKAPQFVHFEGQMERLLGATNIQNTAQSSKGRMDANRINQDSSFLPPVLYRPYFTILDHGEVYSANQAAKDIGMQPVKQLAHKHEKASHVELLENSKVLDHSERPLRFEYRFKMAGPSVRWRVRERDGTLREIVYKTQLPANFAKKSKQTS